MKIEHMAMYVEDLEGAKDFFETYFNGVAGEKYHNAKTGFTSYFLAFQGRSRLEIMNIASAVPGEGQPRLGFAHVAFSTGSKEMVDSLTERLKAAGYEVVSGPRTTGDGYYESCIKDKEGNFIEVTV